jgi:glycosyltransferase involved in cell wall biosynthesis
MKKYSRFFSTELSPFNIERLFVKTKKEKIFNKSKILNNKIINYGNKFGIDLNSSGVTNIASKLSNKSNDYSCFEDYYERIIGTKLNSDYQNNNLKIKKSLFKPCSIIICSYNSNDSIIHTLYSIESQNLSKKQKRGIDVVIIDDGSATPLTKHLQPHINHFSFKTNIIRIEKNKGLANARNIGAINAMYEHILFLDSDILLSNNYLIEHSIALQLFPNGIFVSMKKNIEKESKINTLKNITNGINVPVEYDDKRITKVFREDQNWVNKVNLDGVFEALSDTSLFKSFGYGRNINGYDLPSMVVGHNMSLNKRLFIKAGGFSSFFIGWGLEDTFFGARVISEGGFVVPLINTGVYHINHPPRSGSDSKREEEYYNNLVLYRQLITKEI